MRLLLDHNLSHRLMRHLAPVYHDLAQVRDFVLERALRELSIELEDRPSWAIISLRGILQLIGPAAAH